MKCESLAYAKIPALNTGVVGTYHSLNSQTDRRGRREFLRYISNLNKIALEGNECEINLYRIIFERTGSKSYELLASEAGPKPLTYLEKKVDWHALAKKYGMKKEVFETLDALVVIGIMLQGNNILSDEELFRSSGRYESENNGNLDSLPNLALRRRLIAVLNNSSINLNDVQFAGSLYTAWYAQIRDYEIMCPTAAGFCIGGGKKGIICGYRHLKNLSRFLETGKIDVPLSWDKFKIKSPLGKCWGTSSEKIEKIILSAS